MIPTSNSKAAILKYTAIALAVVLLISVALFALSMWEKQRGNFPEAPKLDQTLEYNGRKYEQKRGIETFLVLGLDKYQNYVSSESYNNDKQADFLMLFVFDTEEKKYSAIHINRDTMTDVARLGVAGERISTSVEQIALAHTHGNGREVSCRNVADRKSVV